MSLNRPDIQEPLLSQSSLEPVSDEGAYQHFVDDVNSGETNGRYLVIEKKGEQERVVYRELGWAEKIARFFGGAKHTHINTVVDHVYASAKSFTNNQLRDQVITALYKKSLEKEPRKSDLDAAKDKILENYNAKIQSHEPARVSFTLERLNADEKAALIRHIKSQFQPLCEKKDAELLKDLEVWINSITLRDELKKSQVDELIYRGLKDQTIAYLLDKMEKIFRAVRYDTRGHEAFGALTNFSDGEKETIALHVKDLKEKVTPEIVNIDNKTLFQWLVEKLSDVSFRASYFADETDPSQLFINAADWKLK